MKLLKSYLYKTFKLYFSTDNGVNQPARWNAWGAFLIVVGTLCAAFSNSVVHSLVCPLPASQLLFLKSGLGFLICSPILIRFHQKIIKTPNKKWHFQKALFGAAGNIFWLTALQKLPLADATTLSLTSALLTTLGAALFFGEKLRLATFSALTLGFMGVVLSVSPSFHLFSYVALLPLASAACYTASSLIVKKVSLVDPMPVSLIYLLMGMATLSAPFAFMEWTPLSATDAIYVVILAISYAVIQWSLIGAYTYGNAGFLAPFKFIRFPLSILVSVFVFHEVITPELLLGGLLILTGCLLIQFTRKDPSYLYTSRKEQ